MSVGGAYVAQQTCKLLAKIRLVATTGEERRRRCTRAMQTEGLYLQPTSIPERRTPRVLLLSVGGDNNNTVSLAASLFFQVFQTCPPHEKTRDVDVIM